MVVLIACMVARKSMSDGVRYVKEPRGREIGVQKTGIPVAVGIASVLFRRW